MLIVAYAPTAAAQEPPKNLTPEAEGRDGPGQGEADAPAPTGLSVTSSTDTNVSLIWNSVSNSYRYKLERRAGRFGSWSTVSQYISGTSRTVYSLTCDTTYYFRVSAPGDGSPYSTTFGSASSSVSRATSACPPTIRVDVQNPFVGQAVTMTVSTTGSSGTVSSYQWQEWSGGSWTDLGATTTSAIRSESSSVSGYRIFRVVVAYTSGTPVESYAITIEWKAMTVSVTSSPEFPRSGPAATSTVTLTAGGDVPSGAVYQWQQATSSDWTDLGATTTSPTKEVWSATRGTRKYRVVVSHLGVTAESEPVYVTWDEWAIVAEMIGELSAAVATSSDYTNAQTALLTCMSATSTTSTGPGPKSPADSRAPTRPPAVTFATFDDVLASYTGDVKARMDAGGDCAATSTTMFTRNESVARAELAGLKAGNVVYAGLLDTPHGRQFEANVGDPDELKLVSYLGATTFEPGEFTAPLYAPSDDGGAVGKSDTTPPAIIPALGTGLDCLPAGVNGADLTPRNQLVVLNCLVFSTPHSFWEQNATVLRNSSRYNTWLSYGGEDLCSSWADASIAACKKHDAMWGSLKSFMGTSTDREMDLTWNPRNKLLADFKLLSDVKEHGCDDEVYALTPAVSVPGFNGEWAQIVCYFPSPLIAGAMDWGLRDALETLARTGLFPGSVSSLWPVTRQDEAHVQALPRFVECDGPVSGVADMRLNRGESAIVATWVPINGCVEGIRIREYNLEWHIQFEAPPPNDGYNFPLVPFVSTEPANATSSRVDVSGHVLYGVYPLAPATLVSVRIVLADEVVWGEQHYEHRLTINSN